METNQAIFNEEKIVAKYKSELKLQPAEKTIFKIIEPMFSKSKVLDIGVGTGRTTLHIASFCKSYIGVDYAPNMVEHCKKTFQYQNASFRVVDARNMQQFSNEEFDIVIFSFNGIDYVSFEERDQILNEINRILKPGGYFIFSTHNARNLKKKYAFRMPRNPLNYFKEKQRVKNIEKYNGSIEQYRNKNYFLFFDGAENDWTIRTVYIMPEFQVEILKQHNFSQFRFFNRITGRELSSDTFSTYKEPWLYYLCTKNN